MNPKTSMIDNLSALGLENGDWVLARASLSKISGIKSAKSNTKLLIEAILEIIGKDGVLMGLAFTQSDRFYQWHKLPPFNKDERAITGGLANYMLRYEGAMRSRHPTNSFVSIGSQAQGLMTDHDANKPCFFPIDALIKRGNGKMLLIGCQEDSPGYSTVHWAQNQLGLDLKSRLSGLFSRQYCDDRGEIKKYIKRDIPGCSMGFDAFYKDYTKNDVLKKGKLGEADAWLISAQSAYHIEKSILSLDPTYCLCQRNSCLSCRLTLTYKSVELGRFLRSTLLSK